MSTLDETIDTTLGYLLDGQREARNVLNSAPDTDDTTLTLTYHPKGAQEGARLSIDFEDTYVVTSDPAAKTAEVIRGQFGSTAAAHTSGTVVWVNPKWSRFQVLRAVNEELRALSSAGLYRMATVDLTYTSPVSGYDLTGVTPDDLLDVYEVVADQPGPATHWAPITSWRLIRDAPTDFASGVGIVLNEAGYPGHTVRVLYKRRFTAVTAAQAATDLAQTAGIDTEAHDIVALGAALRLLSAREVRRSQLGAQPDTRRAEEVPPGASLQSSRGLQAIYDRRVAEERTRLARRYPSRGRRPGAMVPI